MISRHWCGIAKAKEAEHYIEHLRNETFPRLASIDSFLGGTILKRTIGDGVEFRIMTTWRSLEAVKEFAGESLDVAVVPPEVEEMMIEYDEHVVHYEVVAVDQV